MVESIDDRSGQGGRGRELAGWRYELIPWGVRFVGRDEQGQAEVLVLVVPQGNQVRRGDNGLRVVVSRA
jgi:hypothetical protein